jgi:hypothetical protein
VRVDLFDYELPVDRIAQEARPRGTSRLLLLDRHTGATSHRRFAELPAILRAGDLLVRNDVGVRPARLFGRDEAGRMVEIFLLSAEDSGRAGGALARPGRRAKTGRPPEEGLGGASRKWPRRSRAAAFDRALDPRCSNGSGAPLPPTSAAKRGADWPEDRAACSDGLRPGTARRRLHRGLHHHRILEKLRAGVEIADHAFRRCRDLKPVLRRHRARDVTEEVAIPADTLAAIARARPRAGA